MLKITNDQFLQISNLANGQALTRCPANPHELELGFFFDGTGNNRANVASGPRRDGGRATSSYSNGESNVSLLERVFADQTYWQRGGRCVARRSFYLEGIGTTAGELDDIVDQGAGTGNTGVSARVHSACLRLRAEAQRYSRLDRIKISAFGFSRGAAAARYFVNCVRARVFERVLSGLAIVDSEPTILTRVDLSDLPDIEITFLGVFDTVAAILHAGEREGEDASRNADNQDVNVHLRDGSAMAICHIIAGDERRANFSLNSIRSAGGAIPSGGEEIKVPGAHSDIGGGYVSGPEAVLPVEPVFEHHSNRTAAASARSAFRAHFHAFAVRQRAAGIAPPSPNRFHYLRDQISGDDFQTAYHGVGVWLRPEVRLGTQALCLTLMHEKARAAGVPLRALSTLPESTGSHQVPAPLQPILARLRANRSPTPEQVEFMQCNYSHWSAHYGRADEASLAAFENFEVPSFPFYPNQPSPESGMNRLVHPNEPHRAM